MTNREEQLCSIALTRIKGVTQTVALHLVKSLGSAQKVFEPDAVKELVTQKTYDTLSAAINAGRVEAMERAAMELEFCEKKSIRVLPYNDDAYPYRLREIPDAPVALFYKGNADLNAQRVISIVGTRKISEYGKDICRTFLPKLKEIAPDVLILSGLAYGVDICAHRASLENDLPTVGILAHGLDRIYPSMHRDTAIKMLNQGGLLTEYMSQTNPDKGNFVRRNRIVAGMADATIVIESANKGGALITANLAMEYARDVFAFPGRINDEFSTGCNKLIAEQQASLITSAYDFAKAMNWDINRAENAVKQPTLFPVLTEDEEKIWNELSGKSEGITANMLCVSLNLPIHRVISTLSTMITNGWVKQLCGGRYKLLV